MQVIGKILPVVLKGQVRGAAPHFIEILAPLWPRVAGKAMARRCQPVAFSNGILTLATGSPSWSTELRHLAEEIRAEINSFLGAPVVKKLRVLLMARPDSIESWNPRQQIPLTTEKSAETWEGTKTIHDPEVASIILRSFAKYFARRGGPTD